MLNHFIRTKVVHDIINHSRNRVLVISNLDVPLFGIDDANKHRSHGFSVISKVLNQILFEYGNQELMLIPVFSEIIMTFEISNVVLSKASEDCLKYHVISKSKGR